MALTLNERVEIVLLSGRQGWCMLLKYEIFVTLGRELQTVVLLSITIFFFFFLLLGATARSGLGLLL
jgi:hypothetical protein